MTSPDMTSLASTSITKPKWIGPLDNATAGDIGFLISISNQIRGSERHELRNTPAHTNQSHQPRLHGWCGTDNDVMTYAEGIAKVERVAKNGRALVRGVTEDELLAALEELGYPDLADD